MDELDAAIADLDERAVDSDERIVPPPTNPMAVARMFIEENYTVDRVGVLRHHRGDFRSWDGRCWPEAEDRTLQAELYRWLETAVYWKFSSTKPPDLVPFEPNRRKLGDVLEALKAAGHLPALVAPPVWLDVDGPLQANEYIAMHNGLLHMPTRSLVAHDPHLFVLNALGFDYDPDAQPPRRWGAFLRELWGDDAESIDTLAEVMGYILGGDTRQQKLFMLIGPKRSGKGTVARVLTGLLGQHNTTAPTLSSLTTNFGLQDLVGKPLAVVSDARLGGRADGLVAVERLLSISGEDSLTIDRKYRDPWTGRLPTRFLILTNEIPRFTDSSGALASRFVMLTTNTSFYGREDPTLTDALLAEAPGIFNWALRGLDRLNARGHFAPPASSQEALRHLEDLASPVGAFVRDRCEVGPAREADFDDLFEEWKNWCTTEGRDRPGTKNVFARDLRAVVPGLRLARPRDDGGRRRMYQGLAVGKQLEPSAPNRAQDSDGSRWAQMPDEQNRRSEAVGADGTGSNPLFATSEDEDTSEDLTLRGPP